MQGYKLGDMMYVTKKSFSGAVAAMNSRLEAVGEKLAKLRHHIQARLDRINAQIEDSMKTQGLIKDDVCHHAQLSFDVMVLSTTC